MISQKLMKWWKLKDEYKNLLINYYERKDTAKIKKFLKENCFMKI